MTAISRAISHVRDRLPKSASVAAVGSTIYVRDGFEEDDITALKGDVVDGRELDVIDYFSDEHKAIIKLRNRVTLGQ